ncbi:MAG: flavodoxin domain-containing protein [Candidatus Bathyarchaeota archaeon]|nr:flavodoxin domain-containing protein [Candidatus Bathyarchaeota archaeon]
MKKLLKIILAVFAVIILAFVIIGAILFLDLAAYTATGTQTLTPQGASMGTALVLYDPGLSGASTRVAEKVASELQSQGFTVTLAGIKSSAASVTSGYDVIVVGGPIYAGAPTASVIGTLNSLNPDANTKVGVFGSGQCATTPEDIAQIKGGVAALQSGGVLSNAVVVKIGETEDIDARASDFVAQLVR